MHPNPSDVGRSLPELFDSERCLACHDNVGEDLERSIHGTQKIDPAESYENCLDCHDPHRVLSTDTAQGKFDPNRPAAEQCATCHELQTKLPALDDEDASCMACHRWTHHAEPNAAEKIGNFCFTCHADQGTDAQKLTAQSVALLETATYRQTPHATVACTECHTQAAAFRHDKQPAANCRRCHLPHDEKKAHDAHSSVACQACHLQEIQPVRENDGERIVWRRDRDGNQSSNIHEMITFEDAQACQRCHASGNPVGASSMVLPAKGVICMVCHTATLSFGDTITAVSLIVFAAGLGMSLLMILSVSSGKNANPGITAKTPSTATRSAPGTRPLYAFGLVKEIVFNVFFQKRLFKRSAGRWLIHGLLVFPMGLRFLWGITALSASLWRPQWPWVWEMIDKNNWLTALFFDITGMMILVGVVLALSRHRFDRSQRIAGLPRRSRLALALLGSIVAAGFVLEGLRIAMTGTTGSAAYAFIGYGISRLFSNPEIVTDIYGYFWYVHAALTGAFVVYLPFSRLLHIIWSPVVLALNAATSHD